MSLLILCHVVVTVLAFRTFQSNSCAHNFHLAFNIFTYVLLMVASHQFLGIKKKAYFHSPKHCIMWTNGSQASFLIFQFSIFTFTILYLHPQYSIIHPVLPAFHRKCQGNDASHLLTYMQLQYPDLHFQHS